jgi:acetyltransferase-like isoleucine patch superfamily enzyme/ADP-ribose pyrophosphatase YjhB (NUDIX family)
MRGAYRPEHLAAYARQTAVAARFPNVTFLGPCFIREDVTIEARKDYGRIIIGPWVHIGAGTALRCHEGTLRIGAKTVFGRECTINAWLDVEIGDACLFADDVYLCDFDHVTDRLDVAIKDQGIVKSPVRIGDDVWLGTKVVVTRGTRVGHGCAVGAASVLRGDFPPLSVVVGSPARVVRSRDPEVERVRRAAGMDSLRLRDAVRGLVTDDQGRILLVHYTVPDEEAPVGVWACPGAAVEGDEDSGAVLLREVERVLGLRLDGVGDPVWVREMVQPSDEDDGLRETYYLLEIEGIPAGQVDIDVSRLDVSEHVDAVRWWTLEEIAEAQRRPEGEARPAEGGIPGVVFSPLALSHLLGDLFAHGRPETPRQVPAEGERRVPGVRRH